jgi:uncharacterized protein (UPF0332 family)
MQKLEDFVKECFQWENGIRTIQPSQNLIRAYHKKSRDPIKAMEATRREGIVEWTIEASYYAKYHIVYAVLSKLGVKSENHTCSIALFEFLFKDKVSPATINELKQSKDERVRTQYYPVTEEFDLENVAYKTKTFVLEIEQLMDRLDTNEINRLRNRIEEVKNSF